MAHHDPACRLLVLRNVPALIIWIQCETLDSFQLCLTENEGAYASGLTLE